MPRRSIGLHRRVEKVNRTGLWTVSQHYSSPTYLVPPAFRLSRLFFLFPLVSNCDFFWFSLTSPPRDAALPLSPRPSSRIHGSSLARRLQCLGPPLYARIMHCTLRHRCHPVLLPPLPSQPAASLSRTSLSGRLRPSCIRSHVIRAKGL